MADMHTPLLPCPFCGGENLEFYFADIDGWIAHVRCIECDDMIGPMSECKYDDKFEAAEDASTKWNRRAPSQDAETVKALREALSAAAFKMIADEFDIMTAQRVQDAGWTWPSDGPRLINPITFSAVAALAGSAS